MPRKAKRSAGESKEEKRPGPFSLQAFVVAFAVVGFIVAAVFFAAYQTCSFQGCPSVAQVSGFVPDEASVVLDRNGKELGRLYRVNRVSVALDSLPPYVPEAFVATEDQHFYQHGAVDWLRVPAALWKNIRAGGVQEGFSTISMQVARNLFPKRLPAQRRTLSRKIAEMRVAREIEHGYTKNQILEIYLNQIYFGSGTWGIQAATQEYFGHPATELTLGEATLLAGLPAAPSRLNPREDMDAALNRRKTVLRRMVQSGYLTQAQADEVRPTRPVLARSSAKSEGPAPYFVENVRRLLEDRLAGALYTEGYRIHTTLDLRTQEATKRELSRQLRAIEQGRYGAFRHPTFSQATADGSSNEDPNITPYLQGAALVMAAGTGDILAMVGGRDFEASRFNRATQALRQPGSAFKPFVYAAAIRARLPPNTILQDAPMRLVQNGKVWEPQNYDGSFSGPVTMRQALVQSRSVASIRLAREVGLDAIVDMAHDLGISASIPPYPSIAIGTAGVSLIEMVAAYSTFATLGDRPEPRYITSLVDRHGQTMLSFPPRIRRVLDPDVAFVTVDLMRGVVDRGTGAAVRRVGFSFPAAGKTGTTNTSADAWFIGFTPDVTAGIWIGMDRPQRIVRSATGGRLAAPVWGRIMRAIAKRRAEWKPPPGVERYRVGPNGEVLARNCPPTDDMTEEYFLSGTVRALECDDSGTSGDSPVADSAYRHGSWWSRLRNRLFPGSGKPAGDSGQIPDTGSTPRQRSGDSLPPRLDSGLASPRTPPDSASRSRPDSASRLRPDSASRPRPDTMARPRSDTTPKPTRPDTGGGGGGDPPR